MIRPILGDDREAWSGLFRSYGVFYETDFSDEVLEKVWLVLLTAGSGIDAVVAENDEGTVVGFAHYRSHPDTFSGGRDWFLDDLYVHPDARGAGHATALIEHIADLARETGPAGTLRWITAADNERAQRVYDRVATKTTWVTYEVKL
jgi:ribosomal protein S18 acetylase RimI-like enzyme